MNPNKDDEISPTKPEVTDINHIRHIQNLVVQEGIKFYQCHHSNG